MSKEVWVSVKGYEGHYEASSFSRIRGLDRHVKNSVYGKRRMNGKILKPAKSPQGYWGVSLTLDGIATTMLVHRILAIAFIPNPENKKCVNHKNGIRSDNRIENLEWATHSENNQHAYDELGKTVTRPKGADSIFSKKVKCDTLDLVFNSVREAQEALLVANVSQVCRGLYSHSHGLVFRYI